MRLPPELWQDGALVDRVGSRFGLRFCEFRPDGFYLNGSRFKLLGLNRHQSFPYVGGAMPKRVQRRDADLIKGTGRKPRADEPLPPEPPFPRPVRRNRPARL